MINKLAAKTLITAVDNIRETYGRDPAYAATLIELELEKGLAMAHIRGIERAAILCRDAGAMALYQELSEKASDLKDRYHL